ncbi:ClbS/DfsB family four-helix bundle protein [Peptostreptococcus faecalis]|uniref:ClbS/DfsB family four-helix bundle protein n=1 Tax=Peptostreptococcus faecalis TaxID=2045015 RepID=UPI000C7B9735|nr:ClbS/DfsB family four-helix bundle protein [Peptostreptococcus faecalis]
MARPSSKNDLIKASSEKFKKMIMLIDSLEEGVLNTEFDFNDDAKKKEGHWSRDKNIRDIYIHLYEWHQLTLNWVKSNINGKKANFLPDPYNWRTYGKMNIEFWEKHQSTDVEKARLMLEKSHEDVMNIIKEFSDKELFTKNNFDWTGTTTLGSYFVSSTSSHYDWAIKKIKAHIKSVKNSIK